MRLAKHYPSPTYPYIIEPFAGSASYSVTYPNHQVVLYDLNPKVAGVWNYLIHASSQDILALPTQVNHVDEVISCQEAKWLIGFWLNPGCENPWKSKSKWAKSRTNCGSYWGQSIKERLVKQLPRIRHWQIYNRSCYECSPVEATWFVDPPYQGQVRQRYPYRPTDFESLGEWCRQLPGQVIVCEQEGAEWLPFRSFRINKQSKGVKHTSITKEVIYNTS